MGMAVGTIFKWIDTEDVAGELEGCLDGQCVGVIVAIAPGSTFEVPTATVKWWEMCNRHKAIDPHGTGPYPVDRYLWQVGQL
jgi:hypothetical protein